MSVTASSATEPPIAIVEASKHSFEVNRPNLVSLETNGPIEAIIARQEGANVVKWVWRFGFAAWAVCFLSIPGVSTFLVWLFAAISGTLAFVALFKNRVGSGIGGTIAPVLVTPSIWFLWLAVYPLLFGGAAALNAQSQQQRRSRAKTKPQRKSRTHGRPN